MATELARRIRALPGSRPVFLVAVTGYGRLEDQERAGEAGFDAEVLRALLSGRAQQGEPGEWPAQGAPTFGDRGERRTTRRTR
jgi:hypothetical protein